MSFSTTGYGLRRGAKKRSKKSLKHRVIRRLWWEYKNKALTRGREFKLTFAEFRRIVQEACYLCSQPPKPFLSLTRRFKCEVNLNGIDRVDTTLGYTMDNVKACCTKCNRMKSDIKLEEFLDHVSKIQTDL